jgi:hypothetical protein
MKEIKKVIEDYFSASHFGDMKKLAEIFHPDCRISGVINNEYVDWSLKEFFARIEISCKENPPSKTYNKKIILLDASTHVAVVKAAVEIGPLNFTDYISLVKLNGKWVIRNKVFNN